MSRSERRRASAPTTAKSDRRRLILFGTLGLLALALIVVFAVASHSPEAKLASDAPTLADIKVGQPAPGFSVSTTVGPFSIPSTDKKPVLLEVFATWCPHCQRETSVLNKIYARYGNRVDVVSVSGNQNGMDGVSQESQADVYAFTQKFKVQYPVAYDPTLDVMKKYLQGGYPTMVIIGSDNKIRKILTAEQSEKALSTELDAALKA